MSHSNFSVKKDFVQRIKAIAKKTKYGGKQCERISSELIRFIKEELYEKYRSLYDRLTFDNEEPQKFSDSTIKNAIAKQKCSLDLYDVAGTYLFREDWWTKKRDKYIINKDDLYNRIEQIPNSLDLILKKSKLIWSGMEVIDEIPNKKITLSDVYITRTVEADINKFIQNKEPIILIQGNAGHGKTTLLWQLYKEYQPRKNDFLTFFIRANQLQEEDWYLWEQAIVEASKTKLTPLLLLDTIDILLHSKADSLKLIQQLHSFEELGAVTVLTSRLEEAKTIEIYETGLNFKIIELKFYNQEELPKAIRQHVLRYHNYRHIEEVEENSKTIIHSVSQGRSLLGVCRRPLTLRMLFTIYAPNKIPQYINVFELYRKYWNLKVYSDKRDPDEHNFIIGKASDLSLAASLVALIMVQEGKPVVRTTTVESYCKQAKINYNEILKLKNRGVIKQNQGICYFFHQTFFEYSAAYAFSIANKIAQPIQLLFHQTFPETIEHNSTYDTFLLPIYEQLLLITQKDSSPIVHKALILNLESNYSPRVRSAIYVYSLLYDEVNRIQDSFLNILSKDKSYATILINCGYNFPKNRISNLMFLLDEIWLSGSWNTRAKIIHLIDSLASLKPQLVSDFLTRNGVIDGVLEYASNKKKHLSELKILVSTVFKLDSLSPITTWKIISKVFLFAKYDPTVRTHVLKLTLESKALKKLYPQIILTLEEEFILNNPNIDGKTNNKLVPIWREAWRHKLLNETIDIIDFLKDSIKIEHLSLRKSRLLAIGDYALNLDEEKASLVFSFFKEYDNPRKEYHFRLCLLKSFTDFLSYKEDEFTPLERFFWSDFEDHLNNLNEMLLFPASNKRSLAFFDAYVGTFVKGYYYGTKLKDCFDKVSILNDRSFWFNFIQSGKVKKGIQLFTLSLLVELDEAKEVLDSSLMIEYFKKNSKQVKTLTKSLRAVTIHEGVYKESPKAIEYLIDLSLKLDDFSAINSLLAELLKTENVFIKELQSKSTEIYEGTKKILASLNVKDKLLGLKLLHNLYQYRLIELPTFQLFLVDVEEITDQESIQVVLSIIKEYSKSCLFSLKNYRDAKALIKIYYKKTKSIQKTAQSTIIDLAIQNPNYVERPIELFHFSVKVMETYNEQEIINSIPSIIEMVTIHDLDKAIELLLLFFNDSNLKNMSNNKSHKISHNFKRCIGITLSKANKQQRIYLVTKLIEKNHKSLTELVMNALLAKQMIYKQLSNEVNALLSLNNISTEVKDIITKKQNKIAKNLGNKGWYTLIDTLDIKFF